MALSDPPLIEQALPEPGLFMLAQRYQFRDFILSGRRHRHPRLRTYMRLAEDHYAAIAPFLGYSPPPIVLRDSIAPVIVRRGDFLHYVRDQGYVYQPGDSASGFEDLAVACAGTLVAIYLEMPDLAAGLEK